MQILEVPLENIDFDDERFLISEDLHSTGLEDSLRRAGQLSPVHLWTEGGEALVILCGFRRLHAMRRLGMPAAHSILHREGRGTALDAFRLALRECLSHRQLEPLERARVLAGLKKRFGVPQHELVAEYLPLLGLSPHKNVLAAYLQLDALKDPLRKRFRQGHITLSTALRLAGSAASFQSCFDAILDRARWSACMQREVLDLLDELAPIAGSTPEELLGRPAVAAALQDAGLSPAHRGREIRDMLRRWRNPTFTAVMNRFRSHAGSLGLPPSVRLSPDPYFESNRVKVEFAVSSADGFRSLADALKGASCRPALEELFRQAKGA